MFHLVLALITCASTLVSNANTVRCRLVSASQQALDGIVLVVAGALKKTLKRSVQLPPSPTRTSPLWIPPSPSSFTPHHPPLALWLLVFVVGGFNAILVTVALARMGVFQFGLSRLVRLVRRTADSLQGILFVLFVSLPLLVAGETAKLYVLRGTAALAMHLRTGRRHDGTRRTALLVIRVNASDAIVTALVKAYGRILFAGAGTLLALLKAAGYPFLVDLAPPAHLPMHAPRPSTNRPLAPRPPPPAQEFWHSSSWRTLPDLPLVNSVHPAQLRKVADLGSGSFGDVAKVVDVQTGGMLAVKRIRKGTNTKKNKDERQGHLKDRSLHVWNAFLKEVKVHLLMDDHSAFPDLHAAFHDREYFYLVMACGRVCLTERVITDRHYAKDLGSQLVQALRALHERGVVHLDLKPANLLLDAEDNLLVIDYGLAHIFDPDENDANKYPDWERARLAGGGHFPLLWPTKENPDYLFAGGGTKGYICPLVLDQEKVSYGADLFALGGILHEWFTRNVPEFDKEDGVTWIPQAEHHLFTADVNFFQRIFSCELGHRFETWQEVLDHPIWTVYMAPDAFPHKAPPYAR
ncbi:kinase-like domain-containing protein [Mycena vitilis]|nr:kinase-like domain-containing protein [Mycena vitilis]